ncbi:MAG: hypothetical protein PXY39_14845, partial [archaeon]|nr:hypothetical protein [archaeon]
CIDLALNLFGDMQVELSDTNEGSHAKHDALNAVTFCVKTMRGATGHFVASWSAPGYHKPEVGVSIIGANGKIYVNDDKLSLKLNDGQKSDWSRHSLDDNVPFLLAEPEYYREDEQFMMSVRQRQKILPDFQSASKVDYLIDQVLTQSALAAN